MQDFGKYSVGTRVSYSTLPECMISKSMHTNYPLRLYKHHAIHSLEAWFNLCCFEFPFHNFLSYCKATEISYHIVGFIHFYKLFNNIIFSGFNFCILVVLPIGFILQKNS